MDKFFIDEENKGKRIDKYLTEILDVSRSQIQKLLESEKILVNNKSVKKHYFLKEGDEIEVDTNSEQRTDSVSKKPDVVFECEDYLIINKPSGMAVHPDTKNLSGTLIDYLVIEYPEIKRVGNDSIRPGIVHRLDQGVSGLMVVARNQEFFDYIKKEFQDRKILKKYQCLVYGKMSHEYGEIDLSIARSRSDKTKMVALPKGSEEGRDAKTLFKVIEIIKNYSLVEVEIKSGRTHQIRVHMKSLGYPVVGDLKYQTRGLKSKVDISKIFLQSVGLGFNNRSNEWVEYELALDPDLQNFLNSIK